MIRWVHLDPKFDKQKDSLYKAGKKAALAAKNAETIIENIASGLHPQQAGILTQYGEYRVENCMKFDLGAGYRLITSTHRGHLWVLFVGTHDECHRWLENNKGWCPESEKKRIESLPVEGTPDAHDMDNPDRFYDPYSEDPQDYLNEISEKDLRVIFRGLCGL